MGLYLLALGLGLGKDLNEANFLTGVRQQQVIAHPTHRTQSLGVGTRFNGFQHSEIGQVEYEHLGLEDNNAAIGFYTYGLDF